MIYWCDVTMAGRGRDRQLQCLGEFEQVDRPASPFNAGPGMDHRGACCQQQRLDVPQRGAIDRAARHYRLAARRGSMTSISWLNRSRGMLTTTGPGARRWRPGTLRG